MIRGSAYDPWKRAIDLVASIGLIALTAPLQVILALVVRRRLGAPVLFKQTRPGLNEEPFDMLKFRTMLEPDPDAGLVSDQDRMTPLGALLRSTSLDELPSLWNVARGQMSLVGPRPLLLRYTDHMTPTERTRYSVRPGITGWAQVHGRNQLSWDDRLGLDVWYVKNRSITVDAKCVLRTVVNVIRRSDVVIVPGSSMRDLDVERSEAADDRSN